MADAVSSLQVVVEGKDETTRVLKGIESSIIRFVGAVSATLATIGVAVFPIKNAAEFQKEILNVGKTTDFTDSQLTTLSESLKQLSYRLNVSAVDLAKVAAAGGQLGLGKKGGVEGLIAFTEAASRFSSVLDVSVEDAGAGIARLSSIFTVAVKDAERISSLLNELSNNSTASGAELIDMIQRIGTAGGTLNIKQSAALAAVGRDLGLTVETVGTSFNKIFLDLQSKAAEVAPLLGMPVEQFSQLVKTDGIAALKLYTEALARMSNTQRAIVGEQITGGGRIFALVTSLVNDANNGFEILNRHIAEANVGFDQGRSAIKEQERVLSGLLAQGTILKNVFVGLAEAIGRQALPYLTRLAKQFQEWAKDPTIIEFLQRTASYIGSIADTFLTAVKAISGFSAVMGPLLTLLQVFIGLKIVGAVVGLTTSLVNQGKAVASTTKAWYGLLTANRETVQGIAAAAREVEASNATLGAGKTAKSVTPIGKTASFMDTALSSKFGTQDQLAAQTAKMAEAERLLNERTAQRLKVLGDIRNEMNNILTTQKAQAQAAYDAVIAAGGTKKDATRAKTAEKAALNRQLLDLQVQESNLGQAFDASIQRRQANLQSISTQVNQTKQSLAGLGSFSLVFTAIRGAALSAATAVGVFFSRFLAIGGAIAGVVGLITFFLDLFGVLDPVINGIKRLLGIADAAQIEQQRLAAERTAALESEKKKAEELAKVYEATQKSKADSARSGLKKSDLGTVLDGSLAKEIATLEVINGKYADLTFKAADIASSASLVETQWQAVNKQLTEAKARYDSLSATQKRQATESSIFGTPAKPFGARSGVDEKEVNAAKTRVDELTRSLDLLGKARDRFKVDAASTQEQMARVAEEAAAQAAALAPLYDEAGLSALKALETVLSATQKLDKARKDLTEAEKVGNTAKSSDEEKTAFILAAQNVKVLEEELKVLQTSYDEVRLSSAGATVFMANAFPNAAEATVEKVRALIRVLGGLGSETNVSLEKAKTDIDTQVAEIDKKLTEIENTRKARLARLEVLPDKQDATYIKAKDTVNADAARDSLALRSRLNDLKAQQQQLALEGAEAKKLKTTYESLGEAKRKAQDKGRGLVSNFAEVAALKAFTDQQIAAQRRVEQAAKFNSENIKALYESAKSALFSTVNDAKHEVATLGQYLGSRNLTLKLANFDISQNFQNDAYKKFQNEILDTEKKRLESQGLSSEEISKQIGMLQDMFAWTDKIRQSQQDEARQRMIINEIQTQIKSEQEAIAESSAKVAEYAKRAAEAQTAGRADEAKTFATKAQEEAEKAKIATESLTDRVKEYKAEAAKPIAGPLSAKFIVSDDEIKATVEAAAKARVAAAQANVTAFEQSSNAATKEYQDQQARLGALQQQADNYQKTLTAIAQLAPELGKAQVAIAEKILGSTEGLNAVTDSLKSIANSDFRGLDQFATVADQAGRIKEMETAIRGVAQSYAESVVPAGESIAKTSQAVVQNLMQSKELGTATMDSLKAAFADTKITAVVAFPDATEGLQKQLDTKQFTANIAFTSQGNIQKNAEGGPIRGPGTGTSDSILSWVSNGEYINDAQTTSFFGENFFRALKSIARGGQSALSGFSTKLARGIRLPAFAGGGFVGQSVLGAGAGVMSLMPQSNDAVIGRVAVDLTAGGDKVSLIGERAEVDKLINALHKMNRG